ncbi:hypothetical protein GLP37_21530 [Photobacterium phosphoreum]|uniref:helix-turn-helix domain-containing protein n=1 Tax=Photobacterium phosphoreum TaxID=659 RepID=UPI001E2E6CE7|nr:helix-turn-helix domain-containing protein [Photobacterium phosphoreum]MCD9504747.1 hypothetical protein [Photobacterium phosphoreum]
MTLFSSISIPLSTCKDLNLVEKHILSDTVSFNSKGNDNIKSNEYYAWQFGLSRKTIQRAINKLAELNLITIESGLTAKGGWRVISANKVNVESYIEKNKQLAPESRGFSVNVNTEISEGQNDPESRVILSTPEGQNDSVNNSSKRQLNNSIDIDNCSKTIGDISQDLESDCFDDIEQYNNQANQQKPEHDSKSKSSLIKKERKCFVSELDSRSFVQCHEAMKVLEAYKSDGNNIYTGHMALKDWTACEEQMRMVDFDANDYFNAFDEDNRFAAFKKKSGGSLKDFLLIGSKHDFEQAYSHIIIS